MNQSFFMVKKKATIPNNLQAINIAPNLQQFNQLG